MSNYEAQYYMVDEVYNDETLYLKSTKNTGRRDYSFKKMNFGEEPLFFENAYKDEDLKRKVTRPIKTAHMNITKVIVNDKIKKRLENFKVRNFQLFPSVIIDDQEQYHEGYWFFNIYNKLEVLDFEKSEIRRYKPEREFHNVEKFALRADVLDKIPEEERLIFRINGLDRLLTFVHQKVVDIFEEEGVETLNFYKLSEYHSGQQFE